MEENINPTPPDSENHPNPYVIPAAIIVAGALVAGAVIYTSEKKNAANPPTLAAVQETRGPTGNLADDDPILGNPQAPVTLVEFGDFQCPFCHRFFQTAERQIIDTYVKTGKVKFVYRDFAFLGKESEYAAVAAECAQEQGKFWQYHDYLYTHQQGENEGAFLKPNLKRFAQELGLNTDQFNSCLDSDKYLSEVQADTRDGRRVGVSGTPAIFINNRLITGALPYEEFAQAIDEALGQNPR